MIEAKIKPTLTSWRETARRLLASDTAPHDVIWNDREEPILVATQTVPDSGSSPQRRVPPKFLDMCKWVAAHRDPQRWTLMYSLLWRLTHGEPSLLQIEIDDEVKRFNSMHDAVHRDHHKMTAFVRFRKVMHEDGERYIAWHRPDHFIVRLVAPFFRDRFTAMHWTILTPDESVSWDTKELNFGPGVPRSASPQDDELENLWKTYYASTFNPNRLNLSTMKMHVPVRHWATLPEMETLPGLVRNSGGRVDQMLLHADAASAAPSAADFIPKTYTLPQLREAAASCRGCQLCERATQTVFGEGPENAKIVMVGEQPGDQEDLSGRPFVGPAGQLLDEILNEVGLARNQIYITNAVKHFKWEPRGKRRMHSTPSARDVAACFPWVEAELKLIKPQMLICLGSTAAKSLLGPAFRITQQRCQIMRTRWCDWTMATYHPSALLRIPDPAAAQQARRELTADLAMAVARLQSR